MERLLSRNVKTTIVYNDMMLMNKHYSSILLICKTTVLVFAHSGTTVLLLTSAPET